MSSLKEQVKPVNMPFTPDMLDCKIQGIKRTVTFSVKGPKTGRKIMGKNAKGEEVETDEHEWGPLSITVTVDYTGATVRQVFNDHASRSNGLSVRFQQGRKAGEEAMKALDGSTVMFTELLVDSSRALPGDVKALNALNKIKDPVEQEKAKMRMLEALQKELGIK